MATHYLERSSIFQFGGSNSSELLRAVYQDLYGHTVISAQTDELNIPPAGWNVLDDGGSPVEIPSRYTFWYQCQNFALPTLEFTFWVGRMIDNAAVAYQEVVRSAGVQYESQYTKNLLTHQAELLVWEGGGFDSTSIPVIVQRRWDKSMGGVAGPADSYIKTRDDLELTIVYQADDAVELGKIALMGLMVENRVNAEEVSLVEDAVVQTKTQTSWVQPDPFGYLEGKIQLYITLLPDTTAGGNEGLKQRWESMHDTEVVAREIDYSLVRV